MPVTFLILAFLLCLTVWAFFRYSPSGVSRRRLAAVDATAVMLAIVARLTSIGVEAVLVAGRAVVSAGTGKGRRAAAPEKSPKK